MADLLEDERRIGLDRVDYYRDFAGRVAEVKRRLRALLDRVKGEGRKIAGYGAAAKACTLMSYVGIDADDLSCIVDRSQFKQDKLYPGNRLPIRHPDWLLENQPDFALLLSWNFAEEIMLQQAEFRRRGGKFIIPIPEPRIQ